MSQGTTKVLLFGAETVIVYSPANLFMLAVHACKGIAKMWYEKVAYSYNYNNCVTINANVAIKITSDSIANAHTARSDNSSSIS